LTPLTPTDDHRNLRLRRCSSACRPPSFVPAGCGGTPGSAPSPS